MVATGGRSYRSRLVSLDRYSFRKAKAGGQCPPYNFNSLDGRDGRSLLQESVGPLDRYSFRKAKAGGQKISIAVAVHSLDSTLQLQFA